MDIADLRTASHKTITAFYMDDRFLTHLDRGRIIIA